MVLTHMSIIARVSVDCWEPRVPNLMPQESVWYATLKARKENGNSGKFSVVKPKFDYFFIVKYYIKHTYSNGFNYKMLFVSTQPLLKKQLLSVNAIIIRHSPREHRSSPKTVNSCSDPVCSAVDPWMQWYILSSFFNNWKGIVATLRHHYLSSQIRRDYTD